MTTLVVDQGDLERFLHDDVGDTGVMLRRDGLHDRFPLCVVVPC